MKKTILLVIVTLFVGALLTDGFADDSFQNIYVNGVKLDRTTILL